MTESDHHPPQYVVLSKPGCTWCDQARELLRVHGKTFRAREFESGDQLREFLSASGHGRDTVGTSDTTGTSGTSSTPSTSGAPLTFPRVLVHGPRGYVLIGGFEHLRDSLEEPLLNDRESVASRRFTPFPVVHEDAWDFYKKAVASFWTADEVNLAGDVDDWKNKLTPDERHFIKHVLAFFAGSDGIVMENLQANFGVEVRMPEARQFYAYQAMNEAVHSEMYGLMIDALVDDADERGRLFGAIETLPAVSKKAAWATKWLNPSRRFAERLLGMMCVEGILFSGSFCAIFWLKQRGLMPGLCLSNNFIARDEGLHQDFAALMYLKLRRRLPTSVAHDMVREAVTNEKEFICEAVPCRLVGMNSDLMCQYIEFVADRLLASVGYPPAYGSSNPFTWMELISLGAKDNFFERFSSEYQRAGTMAAPEDQVFATDAEF